MKTILLVEDDSNISGIYAMKFQKEGFKVDVANNVVMALEKLKNNYYDLLVLDLNLNPSLPGPKDGIDILKVVRQEPKMQNLKVIVASNYSEQDYPEISLLSQFGVIKYFLKAKTLPEEITNSIKEILK